MAPRTSADARSFIRLAIFFGLLTGLVSAAVPTPEPSANRSVITDPIRIWELPAPQKDLPQPLQIEGRVSYFDPSWKMLWLEHDHVGTYVFLAPKAPAMKDRQRVLIEGSMIPNQGLSADSASVKVLRDYEPVIPLSTQKRINDSVALHGRVVTVDAYVDGQQYIDAEHVRLALIVDDRPVIGWVRPDHPTKIPDWAGKFIRVEGVYSARFDPTNTQTSIELWIGAQRNLKVLGALDDSASFNQPATPINELHRTPPGTPVLVRGRAEGHAAGSYLVVRDGTGQVTAKTIQEARVPFGTEVDVVGTVTVEGPRWVLSSALYRKAARPPTNPAAAATATLERADQIRQLSLEEAARGRSVNISGLVTWSLPENDFFFLQDVSGGIRMRFDRSKMSAPALGKYLGVEGTTFAGEFMPAVSVQNIRDLGAMSPPVAREVTFEQAITGRQDGQWVALRGFVQRIDSVGDYRLIYVTTPRGEFIGHLQSPVAFVANPGSLVRMLGVCEATPDATGRLTGVMLRIPFLHSITIEEDAPVDYYDLPERSIKALRQIGGARDMSRVRVLGTLLHAAPGRSLYLEQDGVGLQLLSRQTDTWKPGTQIEAVGILGGEGARIVLREAVYRRRGDGQPPAPVEIGEQSKLDPALDARLVRVRGRLIDSSRQQEFTRLTLQAGMTLFEATLDHDASDPKPSAIPTIGSVLELTGIYRLSFDDARQTRGFALQLRSPADLVVFASPGFWTLQRALLALAVLGGCALLGVLWITALRRRVRQQTDQLREQLERQARLEAEIQRAARLESLGVLAGGIAHDFNNLLTIIMGNLGLALLDEQLPAETTHCLKEIQRGAVRAQTLTGQLLTFAKGGEPVRTPVALADIVRGAAERVLQGTEIRCDYEMDSALWYAHADKDQLAQVVQNLLVNSIQAMPEGGHLRIGLSNDRIAAGGKKSLSAGRYVRLTIADSGSGISPEVLPKIFDPYFSTRKTASGLGLATVYSIVKRHEGSIEVQSKVGVGTTFDLWLPAVDLPAEPPAMAEPPTPTVDANAAADRVRRVLLMDDEVSIRKIGEVVLHRMGLEPTIVAEGASAVREFSIAQHEGRPFDLLILDLTITGGMGGKEVIEMIRKLDPNVPAIVSSGYSSDPVMANFESYGFQAVVSKPYEISQLAAVITQLLGHPAAR